MLEGGMIDQTNKISDEAAKSSVIYRQSISDLFVALVAALFHRVERWYTFILTDLCC
jgi:hypothetical protein